MTVAYAEELLWPEAPPIKAVPRLRIGVERFLVERGSLLHSDEDEHLLPALELSFRYGDVIIRCQDPSDRFFLSQRGGALSVARDRGAEARAAALLESFGAVDVECIEDYEPSYGSHADFLIKLDGDVHSFCSFGAYAVPQLRRLGWEIEVAPDYPYHVISHDVPWYAEVDQAEPEADWFSFELGIVVDGRRISLLPSLLEMLDGCPDEESLQTLFLRPTKFFGVKVGGNNYVPVEPDRLRHLFQVLRDIYDDARCPLKKQMKDGALLLPRGAAGALDGLDDALDCPAQRSLQWYGADALREQARVLASDVDAEAVTPAVGLQATLRSYQREGLAWLQRLRELGMSGVLADDMGLGKTLQTISHLAKEKEEGRMVHPCLIIAPTSLLENWRREIAKFAPFLTTMVLHGTQRQKCFSKIDETDVVLTTYQLLHRDMEVFQKHHFYLMILDEAQAIKNGKSRSHRAVCQVRSDLRVCLSGTPVENNLEEMWSLFDFLMPGFLGSAEQFRLRFRTPIEQGDEEQLDRLRRRVSPFIIRRMKDDVVKELPPKTEIVRPVELGQEQRQLYEGIRIAAHAEVRQIVRRKGLRGSTIAVLDALMKLRQVCCDPRLVPVQAARRVEESAKYNALINMVKQQTSDGRRILVFSQFTSMLRLISDGLKQEGIGHISLTGASGDRQGLCDIFQRGEVDVFLISLKAGGTGLNLTTADTIIHYDPWWNPAAQAQATDRAYRIGQKNPVFVYNLIVAGSVEERMLRLQQKKRLLANAVLSNGGGLQGLGEDDLEDLFAPIETESLDDEAF